MVVTVLSYVCISDYTRTQTKGLKYESAIGPGAFKIIIFITLLLWDSGYLLLDDICNQSFTL